MNEILTAIGRKVIFIILLLVTYWIVDHTLLNGFDTAMEIKNDPKAIALLLGLLSISIALS